VAEVKLEAAKELKSDPTTRPDTPEEAELKSLKLKAEKLQHKIEQKVKFSETGIYACEVKGCGFKSKVANPTDWHCARNLCDKFQTGACTYKNCHFKHELKNSQVPPTNGPGGLGQKSTTPTLAPSA
jgi:hypothetical protein